MSTEKQPEAATITANPQAGAGNSICIEVMKDIEIDGFEEGQFLTCVPANNTFKDGDLVIARVERPRRPGRPIWRVRRVWQHDEKTLRFEHYCQLLPPLYYPRGDVEIKYIVERH